MDTTQSSLRRPRGWLDRCSRRQAILALGACAAALLSSGCSVTSILASTTPGGRKALHNLAYGPGPREGVDVYQPRATPAPAPVVVFIYGGSWQSGDRATYRFVGKALAAKGFLTFIPDYRVCPEVRYPDFLRDNARAVRWVRDNAERFGGDPRRLFLVGHSAGAYNVAMLALDGRWLREVAMDPARDLRAVVGLAGPYDFLPLKDETLKTIFGPQATRPATQPINHVSGQAPPMLLAAGAGDTTVDPANTTRLAARIQQRGGEVEVRLYPGVSHTRIIGAVAGPLHSLAPTLTDTVAFMQAHDLEAGAQP